MRFHTKKKNHIKLHVHVFFIFFYRHFEFQLNCIFFFRWPYWLITYFIIINWYLFQLRKAYFKQLEEIGSLKEQISLKDKRIRQLEEEISMLKLPVAGGESGEGQSECWVRKNQNVMWTSGTSHVNMWQIIM